ncbi:MAG: tyrosine-type recombinase/integrase, partial [Corynebacterium sp.]
MPRRREWGKITKKKTRYYAEYTGPDLKRHTPGHSFPTRPDAELWLGQERRLIDLDAWTPPAIRAARAEATGLTVAQWLDQFNDIVHAGGLKESTMQQYRRVTRTRITAPDTTDRDILALAHTPITALTTADVYRWWDGLQRAWPTARTTNQHAYKRLRAAMEEAVRRGMVTANPVKVDAAGRRVQTKEKYLPSDGEIQAILEAMPDRYKALTSLVLHHGLRIGEALALEVSDVTVAPSEVPLLPRVTVHVRRNVQRVHRDTGTV